MCEEGKEGFVASFVDLNNPKKNTSLSFPLFGHFPFHSLFDHEQGPSARLKPALSSVGLVLGE